MYTFLLRYNVHDSPDANAFALSASQTKNDLEICAAYTGGKPAGTDMVVVEIELLSGFGVAPATLEKLKTDGEGKKTSPIYTLNTKH